MGIAPEGVGRDPTAVVPGRHRTADGRCAGGRCLAVDRARRPAGEDADAALIDINAASAQELETLPGIGPVLAGRIIEHREQNGPFQRTDQLTAVRGIGSATYERIRPLVAAGE